MLKEISTYGALLLTTMVVIRATTMEPESEADVRSLYQRNADLSYINSNINWRAEYAANDFTKDVVLLAEARSGIFSEPLSSRKQPLTVSHSDQSNDSPPVSVSVLTELDPTLTFLTNDTQEETDNGSLSLDRESTINTGLSLLFPRQRIQPKPVSLQD